MKRAIVVGASSGIGFEVARLLKQNGWTVGVAARRVVSLVEFDYAARIDVNDKDAGKQLLEMVESMGGMELYFHAAGIGHQNRNLEEETELQTVKTNALGFTRMVGTAFRYMADHGGGHIAVISSIAGTKGLGPAPAYSATKALQNTYIQSLEQLANSRRLNIRFTDLRPGFVDTDLLNDGNRYPMLLDKKHVARDMVQSIEKHRHVRVIDWRWRAITWLWRRIPRFLWRRIPLLLTALTASITLSATVPDAFPSGDWGDQRNGTYKNPVLNADYSDPDVIRVNDRYYMVASDFHFMGMQVLESTDLMNWQIVSQVFDRFDYPGWDENRHYGGGSWAPAIRHHDGLFYVYFCTPDEGLFMSTASEATGSWSPLHCVKAVEKWEDPCPFWDDDGQAYLGRSQYGAGPIIIHKMTADGRQLLDDGVTIYTGPVAEGTKIMKRDGYYYLIIPEGGVCCGWQTVLRSRNIYGPYEKRVVLEQGSTDINGPHQGALVEAPSLPGMEGGESAWWFFHFQETHPRGRVVHMQPARWKDGWPLIGVDIDGNGIGEPVSVWPIASTVTTEAVHLEPTSDDFTAGPLFWAGQKQRALGLQWQWNHNPVDSLWSLSERRGWLTLHAMTATDLKTSRNMLTQKTVGYESLATTRLDCSALREGDHAGLLCTGKQFMAVGVCRQKGKNYFYLEQDGERQLLGAFKQKDVFLRVDIDSERNEHQFFVSTDGRKFSPVGQPFPLRMGYWKGSRIGLYCYTTEKAQGGKAQFDYFHYDINR